VTALGRRFWRLYSSSATSNLADGIGKTALPLLAASYTRSPLLVSGLVTFAYLPWLLFALPGGALVDRVDRRHAMAAANAMRALCMGVLGLLALTHAAGIAVLYVVAFLLGLAETVYDSATRAILPQVVDAARLDSANSLLTVEETLGQTFLGAPIGSALFAVAVGLPLLVNAAGFTIAAVLVLTLGGAYRPTRSHPQASVRRDMSDGVRWLARHRLLRGLTVISAVSALASSMSSAVLVLYVLEVLRLPSGDFGLMLLAGGVGALIGGLGTPALARRLGRPSVLVGGAVLSAVAAGLMATTRDGVVAAGLFAASAAGILVWNVLTMSLRQALIPAAMFGRVQGAYRTLVWGAIPIGSLVGGALATRFGLRPVFALSGAVLLLAAAALAVLVQRHRAELAELPGSAATEPGPLAESQPVG
jgi:Na+/melibiose symporter-like transporter